MTLSNRVISKFYVGAQHDAITGANEHESLFCKVKTELLIDVGSLTTDDAGQMGRMRRILALVILL